MCVWWWRAGSRAASPLVPLLAEQILPSSRSPDFAPWLQRRHRAAVGLVAALPVRQRLSFASRNNNAAASLPAPVVSFPSSPPFLTERERGERDTVSCARPLRRSITSASQTPLTSSPPPPTRSFARAPPGKHPRADVRSRAGEGALGKQLKASRSHLFSLPKRLAACLCKRRN